MHHVTSAGVAGKGRGNWMNCLDGSLTRLASWCRLEAEPDLSAGDLSCSPRGPLHVGSSVGYLSFLIAWWWASKTEQPLRAVQKPYPLCG